jgi:hypothetical protein
MGTIAADLSGVDDRAASRIMAATEQDKSLAGSLISRQFEELVRQPRRGLTNSASTSDSSGCIG